MKRLTSSSNGLTGYKMNASPLHRVIQRHFVLPEVLRVLRRMPWFPQAFARYRFQPFAHCMDHSDHMQEALIRSLCADQLMALEPPPAGMASTTLSVGPQSPHAAAPFPGTVDDPDRLDARTEEDPSAERIAELARAHGPLSLVMAHALGPGQGGRLYRDHHAIVVLFTFLYEERHIAVAMDGNDLQQNEVMDRVRAYSDRHELSCEDMQTSELLEVQGVLPGQLHVAQLCFRLIDLESLIKASRTKYQATRHLPPTGLPSLGPGASGPCRQPNVVRWLANAQVRQRPLPPELKEALFALFRRSPEVIERFEWPLASRPHLEE